MEEIVEEGKTVEEAIESALKRLGMEREEVEIEVIDQGGKGMLTWRGAKPAVVRVVPRRSGVAWAERITKDILALMQINAHIQSYDRDGIQVLDVEAAGLEGLLIGKNGQTLSALQHIVDRILHKKGVKGMKAMIDIANYRKRRNEMLAEKARNLAIQAKNLKSEVAMDPLPPSDRRVIHLALSNDPKVRTYTIGEGLMRSVVVAPVSS